MRKFIVVIMMYGVSVLAFAQASSSQWQSGTITQVSAHKAGPEERASGTVQYDVSIKVANTVYVVLYTPRNGSNTVEYRRGFDLLVLVGADALTFNNNGDLSGTTTTVPILHREVLPATSGPDLSRVPGEYYSLKLQHLSEALNLSEEQQRQIKPTLEQETAEVGEFWDNPVISRKDKLNRWEKTVQSSDKKLKPFLSAVQVQKLQEMRKEQKEKLKKINTQEKHQTTASPGK